MKTILLVAALFCVALSPAYGQTDWCGADLNQLSDEELARALDIMQRDKQLQGRSNVVDSVAVTVHIVEARASGSITFTPDDVEAEIAKVNRIFGSIGVNFFICGSPRIIQGAGAYNFTTGDELNAFSYVPNTINIYFVDDVVTNSGQGLCGYAQFPFVDRPQDRYVMMNKLCSTDGATLIHELGHFYGLYHTHETAFGRELVDGSNCTRAGDRLCDTSADPNLSNPSYMAGCTYISEITDARGARYTPPVTNFMSYAPSSCQRFFSPQQQEIMLDVHLNENAYLTSNCDFYPDFAITRDLDFLKIRSDQNITVNYEIRQVDATRGNNVNLKISLADEPDAIGLFLYEERLNFTEEDKTIDFNLDLPLPRLKGSGTYYLQAVIDANNEVIERTEKNNLALTTIEVDNSQLGDASIFPNPTQDILKLFIRDEEARRDVQLRIYRYDGRLVWESEGYKSQDEFFQLIDVSHLQTGLYLLAVDFERGDQAYTFKFFKE